MSTITASSTTLTIRLATSADDPGIARVAELDSATVPTGTLLLALVDGELHAALSLESGAVIADPFLPTGPLVALLRDRAAAMTDARPARRLTIISRLRAVRGLGLRPTA